MATSTLNPNAPIFVPLAYQAVEDFSDQWWDLVHSSPWFRQYWIQEYRFDDADIPQIESPFADVYDSDDFSDPHDDAVSDSLSDPPKEAERGKMDLISLGLLKWRKPRGATEMPKYWGKAPKIVNLRVSPRPIKQPR